MKCRFKRLAVLLALLAIATTWLSGTSKPNIVLIMADDIGFECYGSYGSEYYSTPNIDRLAATGVRFTNAHAQPLCTPSRVKIMTGRYNFRNYTTFGNLDVSQPTFAKVAKSVGYSTAVAGKWQLTAGNLDGPHEAGFDEYCLWHFSPPGSPNPEPVGPRFKNKGERYKSPHLFKNGKEVPGTKGKYGPDLAADFICDFIERKQDEPFLVYYPMILVHNPFDPTPDSDDWESKDEEKEAILHFREMVYYMDKVIGRIVAKLEETGLREDTMIIVTGDNGTNGSITSPFPERGGIKGGKGTMKDAGTRVAFVVSWPAKIQSGAVVSSPVDFADVLPTVAQVVGASVAPNSDGVSILPLLQGDLSKARGWVFVSYSRDGLKNAPYRCFIRDEQWKLYADGTLFNVPQDWLEERPVVGPRGREARQKLQPILDRILSGVPEEHIQWD